MRRLSEKIIVVAGAAGNVGQGIVRTFLQENATVIAPSRSKEKLAELKDYCSDLGTGKLITLRGNLGDEQAAVELTDSIKAYYSNVDAVVASLGGWWQGEDMLNIDVSIWKRVMIDNLMSHILTIKNLVPLIKPKGFYFHLNGYGAETVIQGAAPVTMTAAAQKMMALTLAEELKEQNIKVYELILGIMKTKHRIATAKVNDNWYSPEEIGEYIANMMIGNNPKMDEVVHKLLIK